MGTFRKVKNFKRRSQRLTVKVKRHTTVCGDEIIRPGNICPQSLEEATPQSETV